jgi:hypothetical protein
MMCAGKSRRCPQPDRYVAMLGIGCRAGPNSQFASAVAIKDRKTYCLHRIAYSAKIWQPETTVGAGIDV